MALICKCCLSPVWHVLLHDIRPAATIDKCYEAVQPPLSLLCLPLTDTYIMKICCACI